MQLVLEQENCAHAATAKAITTPHKHTGIIRTPTAATRTRAALGVRLPSNTATPHTAAACLHPGMCGAEQPATMGA